MYPKLNVQSKRDQENTRMRARQEEKTEKQMTTLRSLLKIIKWSAGRREGNVESITMFLNLYT